MESKLDKIDRSILYELDTDCRKSLSEIAKTIRKSPAYVKYRIDRLKEEQVIQAVTFVIDFPQSRTEQYCFIRLKNSDLIEEKLLIDFLFKLTETYRLYYCDGEYDIIVSFLVKNLNDLNDIKNKLLTHFSNIDKLFFNHVGQSTLYLKKYLQGTPDSDYVSPKTNTEDLDVFTKVVLVELQRNPFISLLELSGKLNLSYDKIKYFFKTSKPYRATRLLLSEKWIKKVILFVDITKDFDKLYEYCSFHLNIMQIDNVVGEYNFAIFFEYLPHENPHRIIKEFLYRFKSAIRNHTKLMIINTYKYRMSL